MHYRLTHARDVSCDTYVRLGWNHRPQFDGMLIIMYDYDHLMTCWCFVDDTLFVTNCLDGLGKKVFQHLAMFQLYKIKSTFDAGLGTCLSVKPETSEGGPLNSFGVNSLYRTFCWSWKAPIFGCLERPLGVGGVSSPLSWQHLEKESVLMHAATDKLYRQTFLRVLCVWDNLSMFFPKNRQCLE